MISKSKKAQKGPSWFEVLFGALLSVALGAVLGAAYLITKPVQTVKEIPKDAPTGAVYYLEGARDFNKSMVIEEKRKELSAGQSVAVEEGELNAFIGSLSKPSGPAASKPADKNAPPADQKMIEAGTLNIRIRGGKIQFATPVNYNIYGFTGAIIVQATGTFVKDGPGFVFKPESSYAGGLPLARILIVKDIIFGKFLFALPVPEDIRSAWSKASDVSIEGSTLKLKMP